MRLLTRAFSFAICVTLAGCAARLGGGTFLPAASVATMDFAQLSNADAFSVLHRFDGRGGQWPDAKLVAIHGVLYGTASEGGKCRWSASGCGVIFKVTPSGRYAVLHVFGTGADGTFPSGDLLALNGSLYGTTLMGGGKAGACATFSGARYGCGIIFKIDPSGSHYTVLYRFTGKCDGRAPNGGLIELHGELYGTTFSDACPWMNEGGVIFKMSPSGSNFKAIHRFYYKGPVRNPGPGLTYLDGKLYGMTTASMGTIFAVLPSGADFEVVYRFREDDHAIPFGRLYAMGDSLYGTGTGTDDIVQSGRCHGLECGIVFGFQPSTSRFRVLHLFTGGPEDGQHPYGSLIALDGILYGATGQGGTPSSSDCQSSGCGTIFAIRASDGRETIVHRFADVNDGTAPSAGLTLLGGVFYGTAQLGGISSCIGSSYATGCGTIFRLRKPAILKS